MELTITLKETYDIWELRQDTHLTDIEKYPDINKQVIYELDKMRNEIQNKKNELKTQN